MVNVGNFDKKIAFLLQLLVLSNVFTFAQTSPLEQLDKDSLRPSAIVDPTFKDKIAIDGQATSGVCYRPATTIGEILDTKQGFTSLKRVAGKDPSKDWPRVRKGAWTVLESKTKGFVPNRLNADEISAIPSGDLVEGMMVYNTTLDCLMVNTTATPAGWACFNTQTCPED